MPSKLRELALVVSLVPLAACVDDAASSDSSDTSETEQGLTGNIGIWSWGELDGHLDLGPADTQTCFLRGIHGSLKGIGPGVPIGEAEANISIQGSNWDLYTSTTTGPGVAGDATCIPYTANRVILSTYDSTNTASVPATPNRQCFLTAVRSYGNSWAVNFPNGTPPSAQIAIEGSNWVLRSNVVTNDNPDGLNYGGHEEAVCVDVPIDGLYIWDYVAGGSTLVKTMVPAPDANWACGLTGLSGVFLDTWDKPGVEAAPVSGNIWTLTLAAGKGGQVRCLH